MNRRYYDLDPEILAKLKKRWEEQNEIFWQNQEEQERMATQNELDLLEFFKKVA